MFTGLIEGVGTVGSLEPADGRTILTVRTPLAVDLQLGESVAVNGVCLTVTSTNGTGFTADLGPETLRVTSLGRIAPGSRLNLERAMRGDGRFGGHFVQGHVDGLGSVSAVRQDGEARWLTIDYPPDAAIYLIPKGAVALDGVSLTVATLRDGQFDVMIIPFTWDHTNLGDRRAGDAVNLEYDMVGKYVARAAQLGGLTGQR